MKIAIASKGDPLSLRTWSGIPYYIIQALETAGHLVIPVQLKEPTQPWYYDWYRRLYYWISKTWFLASVEKRILQKIGKQLDDAVNHIQPAIVLVIHGDFLAYTTFKQPAIIIHDTTFSSLLGYYPEFSNLANRSVKAGNDMYQRALDKAAAAVFSADWASQSALRDYKVKKEKVYTVPLGANLSKIPTINNVDNWIKERSLSSYCNFLFLGVKWERKGGADALRFVKELNKLGIPSKLTVVGCKALISEEDEAFVHQRGFLRKNIAEENNILEELLQSNQCLLLPSVAECYGCVYCEANAYGLPAIGRDTGGIPEIIKEGQNGLLLGKNETPENLASRWKCIWENKAVYIQMGHIARQQYDERLNYKIFVERLTEIAKTLHD